MDNNIVYLYSMKCTAHHHCNGIKSLLLYSSGFCNNEEITDNCLTIHMYNWYNWYNFQWKISHLGINLYTSFLK